MDMMTVNDAIRTLRKNSGKPQHVFATELGIALSSLQKYEQEQLPEPRALARFMALALDGKFYDLHEIFELALLKQLAVPGWTVEFSLQKGNTTRQRGS